MRACCSCTEAASGLAQIERTRGSARRSIVSDAGEYELEKVNDALKAVGAKRIDV